MSCCFRDEKPQKIVSGQRLFFRVEYIIGLDRELFHG